jgi:PAS domain S-box-containing protein
VLTQKIVENIESNLSHEGDFELILNQISDSVLIKDTQNNILFANKVACEILAKDEKDVFGTNADELFTEEDSKKYFKDDLKVIQSRKAIYKIIESYTDKSGKRNVIITDKIPILNELNQVERIVVIRKNLERQSPEVKRLAAKLSEQDAKFDEFSYILSHDLLEPVRMISRFLELIEALLKNHKIKDEKLNKYFGFVMDSCKKMKQIVLRTTKSFKQ